MKKAYLDANILLALAAGEKKEGDQYRSAVRIFDEIKSGKFIAIISSLTLMEVLAVFRTQKGREKSVLDALDRLAQVEYVINEGKSMYDALIGQLLQLANVKFDAGKHTDLNKLMDKSLEIMQKTGGKVKFFKWCKRCGSKNVNYSSYKGMGSDDIIHALLAKELDCEYFITFDRDFESLQGLEEFEPLEFRVIKWTF